MKFRDIFKSLEQEKDENKRQKASNFVKRERVLRTKRNPEDGETPEQGPNNANPGTRERID